MVKITNGKGAIKLVTAGAFNSIFKKQGWKKVEDETVQELMEGEDVHTFDEDDEEEDFDIVDEYDEYDDNFDEDDFDESQPLEKMTIPNLKMYAELSDIDINGLTKKDDIVEAIKKAEASEKE